MAIESVTFDGISAPGLVTDGGRTAINTQPISMEVSDNRKLYPLEEDANDKAGDGDDDAPNPDTTDADKDGDGDGEPSSDAELAEFDPENQEVVAAYDAKYAAEDGTLDFEGSLSAEFWANQEAGKEGLNEDTYKYLESKGIPRATVKQVEAMAQTQKDAQTNSAKADDIKLFEAAGGPDKLKAALEWGKNGGYSKEQQERFNKITAGTDFEAKAEAVEALMARYNRANPPARPKVPGRDATKAQGTPTRGVKGFADQAEASAFRKKLAHDDTRGWAQYKARLAASDWD